MAFGIICEYNPFHNGHLHQINEIRKVSSEPIICVMSGNFTQRGEPAVADKYLRARTALECGADIVLELPVPYCFASAEYFAAAGIEILDRVGVDKLSFGSECADAEKIMKIAAIACSPEFKTRCESLSKKEGNASAYFDLLAEMSGEKDILSNDILGIEYTKAIIKNDLKIKIFPIKREGSAYRDMALIKGDLPSASAVRASIAGGDLSKIADFVPPSTLELLKDAELSSLEYAKDGVLLALRLVDEKKLDVAISDVGLINRILSAARESVSFDEFEIKVQTKKYTSGAIRRAILYILLGVKHSDLEMAPRYTTLLGASEGGREYLASIRKSNDRIKVITKPADAERLCGAERQSELGRRADAFYTMCFENKRESGYYTKKSPMIK